MSDEKIIKNPARYPVTFVTVVFALILLYLLIQGIIFLTKDKIAAYNIGAPQSDNSTAFYNGIILRDEEIYKSPKDGYVSFYAVEEELLSKEAVVCSLDKNGELEKYLHTVYYGADMLSNVSTSKIRQKVIEAVSSFDAMDFSTAARTKADIRSAVYGSLLKDGGEDFMRALDRAVLHTEIADISGFLLQSIDGYEGKDPEDLLPENFTETIKSLSVVRNGDQVEKGAFLYKLALDNKFRVVFPLSESEANRLSSRKALSIRMDDGEEMSGSFEVSRLKDGSPCGILSFRKYGVNYLSDRQVHFTILNKEITGYKIPESSIVKKSFFVVDKSFVSDDINHTTGVIKQILNEKEETSSFISCAVYQKNRDDTANFVIGDDVVYLYSDSLKAGDRLIKEVVDPETGLLKKEFFTLGVMASVEGVYQINQGYCVFKPIVRLENSIESAYVIISSKVVGGLKSYDRIVIDASVTEENDIIFE